MTGGACRAAKCQGYLTTVGRYWDLIVNGVITDDEAIDAFEKMNEKNEENVEKYGDKYVHPPDGD